MPEFKYTAIDRSGQQATGKVDADSADDARKKLMAKGLMVTALSGDAGAPKPVAAAAAPSKGFRFGAKVTPDEVTTMARQLATLLTAGLPLLRALELIHKQERNLLFKDILGQISDSVSQGNNFSEALAAHPKAFDRLFVNMVKAGEAGGVLDKVLGRLAGFREKAQRIQKKVKSAMVYPAVVVSVAVVIVIVLLVKVVPAFQNLLAAQKTAMPPLTAFVIGISSFLQNWMLPSEMSVAGLLRPVIAYGVIFGGYIAAKSWLGSKAGKQVFDRLLFRLPKIGGFVQIVTVSRFARTFGTLMSSGVPILQSINITRDTLSNVVIADSLERVHDRVRDGEPLSVPLEQSGVFPQMVTSMIQVGEETGQLPEMLNRVADIYDEEVDNAVGALTSIIEPVLIVFLAVVVGTIVLAMFLPLITLITQMTGG
jgi:type IV pilus assembly protein PilC